MSQYTPPDKVTWYEVTCFNGKCVKSMHVNCAICSKYHPAHLSRMHGVVEKSNFLPFSPQHWDLTTGFRSSSKPGQKVRHLLYREQISLARKNAVIF